MAKKTYDMRLTRLVNVMCCNDDRFLPGIRDVNQMIPNTLSNNWIDTNGRLVQNQ